MRKTVFHAQHLARGARMAEFAGYEMPIQYPAGVLAEHNWTRERCGLFDVSHMGQIILDGPGAVGLLEKLTPSAFTALKDGVAKYTVLTNDEGGIIDDLIVTRLAAERFFAVINAGCKEKDIEWIRANLPADTTLTVLEDRALIALQGPRAEAVLADILSIDTSDLGYMRYRDTANLFISRLGYTGEDGFEISIPHADAASIWDRFLQHGDVLPVGLAARDSLRLEMGYPLYGHDIDATTSPVEAGLQWIIGRDRDGYVGAGRITRELIGGTTRQRVGLRLTGKGVAREGADILDIDGRAIGVMTSGGFSPTLGASVGQGYLETPRALPGTEILIRVRGRDIEAVVAPLPLVPPKTKATSRKAVTP